MKRSVASVQELNERSRQILRMVIDSYMETGEPIGSRTISRGQGLNLSPATIRNVMADLEDSGLLYSPHTSAGRLPTDAGLRLFVDGLLEIGRLSREEEEGIEARCHAAGRSLSQVLEEAGAMLSGLSRCAGLVVAPKLDAPLRHIEFVNLGPGRALVVLVTEAGMVENRIIEVPVGLPPSALVEAGNYLAARLVGRTLEEARGEILAELEAHRAQLDALTSSVVAAGLAIRNDEDGPDGQLILRGTANLLEDITAKEDLERIRELFEALEHKSTLAKLLDASQNADGVQMFIGAENNLFAHSGCSMVIAPYLNSRERLVGMIGVIGPTRLNYARIIPMVDYTAKMIGRLVG